MLRKTAMLLLLILTLVTATAAAQAPRGQRGRGLFGRRGLGDLSLLLAFSEIREELSVKEQQEELLAALISDVNNQRFALFRDRRDAPNDVSAAELRDKARQLSRQGDELVSVLLEPQQIKRLRELHLQHEGLRALDRQEFVKQLGLSQEQLEQIRAIRGDPPERRASPEQQRKILALLTDQQQRTWDEMKGKEYSFPEGFTRLDRGRRRRFGRPERPTPQR